MLTLPKIMPSRIEKRVRLHVISSIKVPRDGSRCELFRLIGRLLGRDDIWSRARPFLARRTLEEKMN
jgi:hypothetical protein